MAVLGLLVAASAAAGVRLSGEAQRSQLPHALVPRPLGRSVFGHRFRRVSLLFLATLEHRFGTGAGSCIGILRHTCQRDLPTIVPSLPLPKPPRTYRDHAGT
jgi:hypothetical protein